MAKFPENLQQKLNYRREENAFRKLSSKAGLVDFSSNDYLGFSKEKSIAEQAEKIWKNQSNLKNGATGSRLLSGNYALYNRLENCLIKWYKAESALVFNSGYDANLGFFSSVPQRKDVILYDELCHASIRDGLRLSDARSFKFGHNDLNNLELLVERIENDRGGEIYVVTESVFSMDGDSPDLKQLAVFCQKKSLHLIVDEAHAVGVFENGIINQLGLERAIFARIITFGKALGVHGAAILGSQDLKDFLINFCRSFIYSTGLPPHTVAAILAAHQFLYSNKGRKHYERIHQNIDYFNSEIVSQEMEANFMTGHSAIQICTIGGNDKTKKLSETLEKNGFDVRPILSPTVPKGRERLRFCLHAFNSKNEIETALAIVKRALDEK